MSLYDDLDVTRPPGGAGGGAAASGAAAAGWSLPVQKTLLLQQQRRSQQQQHQSTSGGTPHHQRSGSGGSASASSAASSSAAAAAGPTLTPVLNLKARAGLKRDQQSMPVVVGNLGGEFRFNQRTGRMERGPPGGGASGTASASSGGAIGSGASGPVVRSGANDPTLALGPEDEYNPLYPNEYDEVVGMVRAKRKMQELADSERRQQQKQQKKAAAAAAAASASASGGSSQQKQQQQQQPSGHDSDGSFDRSGSDASDDASDHEEEDKKRRMGRGAYIAPPTSLLQQDAKQPEALMPPAAPTPPAFSALLLGKPSLAAKHNVSSAAAKMMAKMGYRDGQGLGREGQGMASALSVEKTSKRGGKIVSELDRYKNPSLVIMLTNMVGPGEVDDDLEGEIKDECQKYGPVVLVTIFELPRPNVPAEEAVRIFVEFERVDSAIKAMNELNGRFFGGRTVTCRFYDTEKFRDLELEGQPLPLELNE